MSTSHECKSCQWIKTTPPEVIGGILSVGKSLEWRVNHYQHSEAILGWLVLQPVEHKPTLDELSKGALDDLGSAIGSVQRAMKTVWTEQFPNDPLERIHTVNFMEREFDQPPPPDYFHVHIFLIPRSKLLGKVIRRKLKPDDAKSEEQYVPWDDYRIFHRIKGENAKGLIENDMPWDHLKNYINPYGAQDKAAKEAWDNKIKKFMNRLRALL